MIFSKVHFAGWCFGVLGLFISTAGSVLKAEASLPLLSSINTRGQVEDCVDCPTPFGGLARRAQLIEEERANSPLLLVDGGNFLFGAGGFDGTAEVVLAAYLKINYDVINLSYQDFRVGKETLLNLMEAYPLPVVSANILDKTSGDKLFPAYRMIERAGLRVAVLGLTSLPRNRSSLPHLEEQLQGLQIGDPTEALGRYLPKLREEADLVLVAFHGDAMRAIRILQPYREQIDGVILPGATRLPPIPDLPVLAPSDKGENLARATMNSSGEVTIGEPIPIDADQEAIDASIAEMITQRKVFLEERRLEEQQRLSTTQTTTLPDPEERIRLMGRDRHQGLRLTVFDMVLEEKNEAGERPLILNVSVTNNIAARLISGLDYAETVQVATLSNKAFLIADDRLVIRHNEADLNREGHLPNQFRIARPGSSVDGQLAFRLPPGDWKSLELVLLHDEFPALQIPLFDAGEVKPVEEPVERFSNEVVSFFIAGVESSETWRGQSPPSGKSWLTVDLRGSSAMSRMADSAALDRSVATEENEKISHAVAMEYFYFPDTVFLETDGQRFIPFDREISEFPEVAAFLPHHEAGGKLVFAVPDKLADHPLFLRAWFPSMALAGAGSRELGNPTSLQLPIREGNPYPLPDSLAALDDAPLQLEILELERALDYQGQAAPEGMALLSLLLRLENRGEEAGLLPLGERFALFVGRDRFPFDRELTRAGPYPPTENLYLPPGDARVISLVIPFPADAEEALFDYRGVSTNQRVTLDLSGAQPEVGETVDSPAPDDRTTEGEWETVGTDPAGVEETADEEEPFRLPKESVLGKERFVPSEEYLPHPGAVEGEEVDGIILWDPRTPLKVNVPEGTSRVRIQMEVPEEWKDQLWDIDFQMESLDGSIRSTAASLQVVDDFDGGRGREQWSQRMNHSTRFYGFAAPDGQFFLEVAGERRANPAWEGTLAIVNHRPREADWVHHPADRHRSAFFPGESVRHVRGEFIGSGEQFILFRFDEDPDNWRLIADSPDGPLDRLEIYELSGRTLHQQNSPFQDTNAFVLPDLHLLPGDYVVEVRGQDQLYSLRWEREADIPEADGPEGEISHFWNKDASGAHRLDWGQPRTGRLPYSGLRSYYRFFVPSREEERMRLTFRPPETMALDIRREGFRERISGEAGETIVEEHFFLPGDHFYFIRTWSGNMERYQVVLERLSFFGDPVGEDSPVSIEGQFPDHPVAAFWPDHQRFNGAWRVANISTIPQTLRLQLHSGHAGLEARWANEESPEIELTLSPGESQDLAVTLILEPDLRNDYPLALDLGIFTGDELIATETWMGQADLTAEAVNAHRRAPLPKSLLGGIDLANIYHGGQPLGDTLEVSREEEFLRGMVRPGQSRGFTLGEPFRVALAGEDPVPVAGVLLHPMHRSPSAHWLHSFRVETSSDGETWEIALEDQMLPSNAEQAFPFDHVRKARFIRFTGLTRHDGENEGQFGIGSIKVVASPDFPLPVAANGINLAETTFGGHLVWSSPLFRYNIFLEPDPENAQVIALRPEERRNPIQWVVGFHHNRAAKMDRVELVYRTPRRHHTDQLGEEILLEAAAESPLGPWQEISRLELEPHQEGEDRLLHFPLEEAFEARFLRFTIPPGWERDPNANRESLMLPHQVKVMEIAPHEQYRSILGEWGHYSRRGPLDYLASPPESAQDPSATNGSTPGGATRAEAVPLDSETFASGSVLVGEREAHFKVETKEGENTLFFDLVGIPTIGFAYEVVNAKGEPVEMREEAGGPDGGGIRLAAEVSPGTYFLRLYEPKRNVVISWDASGSMGPYIGILYAALPTFLQQVDPDRETVQLQVFANHPYFLLPDWSGDRNELLRTLRNYRRVDGSSDSESNLLFASEQMKDREGTKAILLLTDAETGGYRQTEAMWQSFAQTRPRIFSLETSSGGSRWTQDLMQDWADANHGFYDFMRSVGEVEIAFDRANAYLRRPKAYRVRGGGVYQAPPEPGLLKTIAAEPPAGSYYFIFDASGSMMATMEGVQKFELARQAIASVVDALPDNAEAALRVYGHRKRAIEDGADEDTELVIRMGTLNAAHRQTFQEKLQRLRPMGRTPLTLSLEEALRDLRRSRNDVTVVLLTDGGEDTFPRRDPVQASAAIANEAHLNLVIVGFDIHREDWSRQLNAMAEAGQAPYFPAEEAAHLEPALRLASGFTQSSLKILNDRSEVVAEGEFGNTFTLKPGSYQIKSGEIIRTFRIRETEITEIPAF